MSAHSGLFRAQILITEQLRLYDWWRSLSGDCQTPPKSALDPADIASFLPNLTLFERTGDDWRVRLAGTGIFDVLGEEISGRTIADLPLGDGARTWRRALNFSCDTRGPVCGAQRLWWNGPRPTARFWLRLPFAGPAGFPTLIMGHEAFRPFAGDLRAPAIAWAS